VSPRWVTSYEEGIPPTLTYPDGPLHDLLSASASRYPSQAALVFYGRRYTYRDVERATNRFANALSHLGSVRRPGRGHAAQRHKP
jgi:long-chain acyl-CoA synthetase